MLVQIEITEREIVKMKVYLNKITGIDDALVSMLMSKRSWTREKEMKLRALVEKATDSRGFCCNAGSQVMTDFSEQMDKLIKYGVEQGHTTLLRFIDLSFTVEGLHRAGQDDWDAHATRMDNRIVRASTRLADFKEGEVSDYYKDKIKFPFEVFEKFTKCIIPDRIADEFGVIFVRTEYGYIREDLATDRDVKRGLYPEALSSNFVFKVQYPELGHIIQFRDSKGHAHPEVKEVSESIKDKVRNENWWLGENLTRIKQQPREIW